MKTTQEHIDDQLADQREMAESEPKGWRRAVEPVQVIGFAISRSIARLIRFIFPALTVMSVKRVVGDKYHCTVTTKGWFQKYGTIDLFEVNGDVVHRLDDEKGWQVVVDEDRIEGMLRERIAREAA